MNKEIKQNDKVLLQSYVGKKYDKNKVIDEELLQDIVRITQKNNIEVAVIIDRKGEVVDISTGNSVSAMVSLPKTDARCGMRIIHTHPNASSKLSDKDIILLKTSKCTSCAFRNSTKRE